jgi:PAS domain S-box-containing protein
MGEQRIMTGRERTFPEDEIIVSKTDLTGRITYANEVFLDVAGYSEAEVLGQPHNLIRHPDTPRCLFKLMWDTLKTGEEIFVYVNNRARNGDHYWVFAHVTPCQDASGQAVGYHSMRRVPRRAAVQEADALYARLLAEERRHNDSRDGLQSSYDMLINFLAGQGVAYDQFVLAL